jgi:hypothetical protein
MRFLMSVAGKPLVQKRTPPQGGAAGPSQVQKNTWLRPSPSPKNNRVWQSTAMQGLFIGPLLALFVCVVGGIYLWLRASLPQGSGPFTVMSLFNEEANVIQTFP